MRRIRNYFYISVSILFLFFSLFVYLFYFNESVLLGQFYESANKVFKLESIKLIGRNRSSRGEIISSINLKVGDPLFNLNLNDIRQNVLSVPWVKDVSINRNLPNSLLLVIEEYQPSAIWEFNKEQIVLDRDGYHIKNVTGQKVFKDLLLVKGEEADSKISELILALDYHPDIASRLQYAILIAQRRWDIYIDDQVLVKLPTGDISESLFDLKRYLKEYKFIEYGHKKIDMKIRGKIATDKAPRRIINE